MCACVLVSCLFTSISPATAAIDPNIDVSISASAQINSNRQLSINYVSKNTGKSVVTNAAGALFTIFTPPEIGSPTFGSDGGSLVCENKGLAKTSFTPDFRALPPEFDNNTYWACTLYFPSGYVFSVGKSFNFTMTAQIPNSFSGTREIVNFGVYSFEESDYDIAANNAKSNGDVRKAGTNNLSVVNFSVDAVSTPVTTTPKKAKTNTTPTTVTITAPAQLPGDSLENALGSNSKKIVGPSEDFTTKKVMRDDTSDPVTTKKENQQLVWVKENLLKILLVMFGFSAIFTTVWLTKAKIDSKRESGGFTQNMRVKFGR